MQIRLFIFLALALSLSGCTQCSKSAQKFNNTNRSSSSKEERVVRSSKRPDSSRKVREINNDTQNASNNEGELISNKRTIVKMEKENGVYKIPVEINGVEMFFILDTGAGLISISAAEASFLYNQGKLKDEDFIGVANFIDANGDISEGTIIRLRTVKIGNRTLSNIEASVVHNLVAPLLFGQSALEEFGKISIDYNKNEIVFEYFEELENPLDGEEYPTSYMAIKKFVDGDTFWIDNGTEKGLKIRLIGVNTPETVHPQKPVEYYGKEASNYIKELLVNRMVRLEYDIDKKDRNDRILAYVFLEDGTFINAELVKNGYATVMTVPPNVKYSNLFIKLEREARENNRGLWNENH